MGTKQLRIGEYPETSRAPSWDEQDNHPFANQDSETEDDLFASGQAPKPDLSSIDEWEQVRGSAAVEGRLRTLQDAELTEDSVGAYFREISRVSLLSSADEVTLSQAIELSKWLPGVDDEPTQLNSTSNEGTPAFLIGILVRLAPSRAPRSPCARS